MAEERVIAKKELKFSPKFIVIAVLSYFFWVIINIWFGAGLKWWSIYWMLALIFIPILMIGLPFAIWFAYKSAKLRDRDDIFFKKRRQLNSTTVIPFIQNKMLEIYGDHLEVDEIVIKQSGLEGKRTPIAYIMGNGKTSYKPYHILINLLEPDDTFTVRRGIYSFDDMMKLVDDLSDAPIQKLRRITRRATPEGILTELEEEELPDDKYELKIREGDKI